VQKGKFSFIFSKANLLKVYKKKVSEDQIRLYFQKSGDILSKPENIHYLIDWAFVVWVWVKQNKAKYEFMD
ncbi:MAG: hypothetical protein Q7J16_06010, partial [Candidatus Cloacimonadales bacterium]|nr:hypothetical protein [Candidatus Cloacimonadales bacterium]